VERGDRCFFVVFKYKDPSRKKIFKGRKKIYFSGLENGEFLLVDIGSSAHLIQDYEQPPLGPDSLVNRVFDCLKYLAQKLVGVL